MFDKDFLKRYDLKSNFTQRELRDISVMGWTHMQTISNSEIDGWSTYRSFEKNGLERPRYFRFDWNDKTKYQPVEMEPPQTTMTLSYVWGKEKAKQ